MSSTPLIISTGDICDVDGMLAIALYAQSGADLLFVMNFPAYLGVVNGTREKECEYGLGYVYDTETFLRGCNDNDESYRNILKSYTEDSHVNLSFVLRDLAFYMTSNTWSGVNSKGRFYFTIGDVNTINPYSSENCINEVHIYAKCVKAMKRLKAPTGKNSVYNIHGEEETNVASLLEKYERIIMDFNGSAAFLDSCWRSTLLTSVKKKHVKALFVQGGVLAYEEPHTVPKIDNVINRLGCATMNQLYSPSRTEDYLSLFADNSLPIFIIPNNCVENLRNKWEAFLRANSVDFAPVSTFTNLFYNSTYHIAPKPYDLYSAVTLVEYIKSEDVRFLSDPKTLFFNSKYGVSLIHDRGVTWNSARDEYIRNMTSKLSADGKLMRNFETETEILKDIGCRPFSVYLISFEVDGTEKLNLMFYTVLIVQGRLGNDALGSLMRTKYYVVLLRKESDKYTIPKYHQLEEIREITKPDERLISTISQNHVDVLKISVSHEIFKRLKSYVMNNDKSTVELVEPMNLANYIADRVVLEAVKASIGN